VAAVALLGYGSFVLASLVVGTRLLLLHRRTHETPELAIGVALFAGGGLAYGIAVGVYSAPGLDPTLAALLEIVAAFFSHLGAASLALALRQIFRPDVPWARVFQLSITVALTGAFATRLVDPLLFPPPAYVFWPYAVTGSVVYGWSVFESLHCHALMARRARIGLADPAVARRFLLWGIAGAAALGIYLAAMWSRLTEPVAMAPWTVALTSAFGLVAAVGLSLAFFPRRRAALARAEAEAA
jgi:hypothetical protein